MPTAITIAIWVLVAVSVSELFGYLIHRLLHSDRIGWLSRNHMIHHLQLYGPLDPQRPAGPYKGATDDRISLGNVGLEWLLPGVLLLGGILGLLRLLDVPALYQFVLLGTSLLWSLLMFSYLHDRMHIHGFWMEKNPLLRHWFLGARKRHDIHHWALNDAGYMDRNFGIGFFVFDRLFSTHSEQWQLFNQRGYEKARRRLERVLGVPPSTSQQHDHGSATSENDLIGHHISSVKTPNCGANQMKSAHLNVVGGFVTLLVMIFAATQGQAETVLLRKRIGNNAEGITYVTSGRWNNHAVAIDGNDVIAIDLPRFTDLQASSHQPEDGCRQCKGWQKIFDVLPLGVDARVPRGILFLPGKNEFVFSGFHNTNLFRTDEFGNPLAPIVLSGLANPTDFSNYEGLTWIPADAPKHPNTIAALMIRASDFVAHVIYIHTDGTVEAEVLPQPGTPVQAYICGIAYQRQRPGTLLLSECGAGNYAIDEDGNFLNGGPILPAPAGSGGIESIIVDRFSRVFLGAYDGHLYAYDTNYNRLPTTQDRSYVIGLGIAASSITWNSDMERFLFLNFNNNTIEAVPFSISSKHALFNLDPVRANRPASISYLGGGRLAIANRSFPRGIQVVNLPDGSEITRLIFLPPTYPTFPDFQSTGVGAFGPDQFIVRVVNDATALKVVSRTGTPDSSILPNALLPDRFPDLPLSSPAVGRSVQVFDAGGGPRIFTGGSIFDISGNLIHSIDESALGVTVGLDQGTWITGNTFAGIDTGTSTVIIFSVP